MRNLKIYTPFLSALFISSIYSVQVYGQSTFEIPYRIVEEMPAYPGGFDSLNHDLYSVLVYPKKAIRKKIEGTVYVQFVIDTQGKLKDITVLKSPHPLLEKAAVMALMKLTKDWIPRKQKGKPVPVYFNLPIVFKLS